MPSSSADHLLQPPTPTSRTHLQWTAQIFPITFFPGLIPFRQPPAPVAFSVKTSTTETREAESLTSSSFPPNPMPTLLQLHLPLCFQLQGITQIIPSTLSYPHSLLYPSPQLRHTLPRKLQAIPAREAGSLSADLTPSSSPPNQSPSLTHNSVVDHLCALPSTPISSGLHRSSLLQRSSPLILLSQPQLQQTFPGNLVVKPAREAGRLGKQEPCFSFSFFLLSFISSHPVPSKIHRTLPVVASSPSLPLFSGA